MSGDEYGITVVGHIDSGSMTIAREVAIAMSMPMHACVVLVTGDDMHEVTPTDVISSARRFGKTASISAAVLESVCVSYLKEENTTDWRRLREYFFDKKRNNFGTKSKRIKISRPVGVRDARVNKRKSFIKNLKSKSWS